ncbi:metaxin-3-like isoform X2 [Myxocyprinus asiaticus]|uniref:metaxin-3-like isoform X2 n=1 Tax=Myxocyprinus asiaticus TaxID=70543 RepID=UPI002222477F|nr:metaxin-3-like isoform X2 [Myxocyprinus asiaticus]
MQTNMAEPIELLCWGDDWDLPSVHTDSLIVLAYAKFAYAKLTVKCIDWTWRTITASVPQLHHEGSTVTEPTQILNFLRKKRFNADYELTAKEGADTMAYIALLEEKLRPALLHTFWVDAENYANLTRPWFSSHSPFPLNFFVPGRQASLALSRILLTKGESPLLNITEVEGKIYSEAKEGLNLLSHRLGNSNYFFGNMPTSLDAFVFGYIAPLLKAPLPSGQLQKHLNQLDNLCQFCNTILKNYFTDAIAEKKMDDGWQSSQQSPAQTTQT